MKRRFEEARSGLQICRRRTKKKKEKRFDEDEETQEDEKTQNKERSDDEDKKGETRVFKIQVQLGFLSTIPYKSRLKNSIFILELEFLELKF